MVTSAGGNAGRLAVAIEIPHGPVVDSLLDRGIQVFSIHPKQLDRFRDRFSPADAQEDRRDARGLADAVRTDPYGRRGLHPVDREIIPLREGSRLADERTASRPRLRDQLGRYDPPFLALQANRYAP